MELKENEAVVNTAERRLIRQGGKVLKGACHRCGKCCQINPVFPKKAKQGQCKYLDWEKTGDRGTRAVCLLDTRKPMGCALWPEIDDKIPAECGFYWEDE